MTFSKHRFIIYFLLGTLLCSTGCFSYGFTGSSIPEGVNTIYIPFFPDQSNSGLGDLSNRLNRALIDRFINQSKLSLASEEDNADAALSGTIVRYQNTPFSVTGEDESDLNQVSITVRAEFRFTDSDEPEWSQSFQSSFRFDPNENPIEGENVAADNALENIAQNMFNQATGSW